MYSFYGGQKGQDFKISRIFANRANDMLNDLKMRWTSPVGVGDYVFINYGDPSYANEATSAYQKNLDIDLKASGKSFTNSLWQKIYVDRNLTVSPDFPENDNNIYIFLNLDEDTTDEYGESLKEVSDIETEECFGFGYRLIACITGITPRLQVFHQTIDIEDGDPYITLDITNPDTPKLKFYLQRGQRIDSVFKTVINSKELPDVIYTTDGTEYIDENGVVKKATLTYPRLEFKVPKATGFFFGELFGLGPINFYHSIANQTRLNKDLSDYNYIYYKRDADFLANLCDILFNVLIKDKITTDDKEHFYTNDNITELNNSEYIQSQDDETVIFNPIVDGSINSDILTYLKRDFVNLLTTYGIVYKDEISQWVWYRNVDDLSTEIYLSSWLKDVLPRSFTSLDGIVYSLFAICEKLSREEITDVKYIFDQSAVASYSLDVFKKLATLNIHFSEVAKQAMTNDYYINEPTGKIYNFSNVSDTQIEATYLGCITAPAPIARTITVPPYSKVIENDKISYLPNLPEVESSLEDIGNEGVGYYQESFKFYLPTTPDFSFVFNPVRNNDDITSSSEPTDEDAETITVNMPMPIHIYTSDSDTVIDGNTISYKNNTAEPIIISTGDILMYITDKANDIHRGYVYKYIGSKINTVAEKTALVSSDWVQIGDLTGATGIPTAQKSISITIDDTMANGAIAYTGQDTTSYVYNYKAKVVLGGDDTATNDAIIQRILASGEDITNSTGETLPNYGDKMTNNDFISISFYDEGSISSSYWAFYLNGVWQLVSFSGNISSILSSIRNTDELTNKTQAYTINYMENNYLNDHMEELKEVYTSQSIWHEYD